MLSVSLALNLITRTKVVVRQNVTNTTISSRGGDAGGGEQNSSKVSLYTDRHRHHLWNDETFDGGEGKETNPAGKHVLEEPIPDEPLGFSS